MNTTTNEDENKEKGTKAHSGVEKREKEAKKEKKGVKREREARKKAKATIFLSPST